MDKLKGQIRERLGAPAARIRTAPLVLALCCFAAAWVVDVWYTTLRQIEDARTHALANAAHDASIFVRVIEEHTVRTIQSADQAVQFLRYEFMEAGMGLDLRHLLDTGTLLGDIFNLYSIVGPEGDILLSSQPFKPVKLADREHIRTHMGKEDGGLFISKPVLGRISGKWSIQLTRRINRPDGGFGGVVVVSMDPFYFTRLYESAQISEHSVVTLIGSDGVVRARRSINSSRIGQDLSSSPLLKAMGSRKSGVARVRSQTDGRDRVYAFRRLEAYPLWAVVGIDTEDLFAALRPMRIQMLQQAVLSTAAILLFTLVLLVLARRLLRSRAQALHASAAKSQFLSNVSHELRTPLNGILGYAELLKEDLDSAEHREFAQVIHASGMHLLSLVNQLLQLNRIERGQETLALENEDLAPLLHQALSAHRSSAQLKGLRLELSIAPDAPRQLVCDRMKLLQVLNNLLHNAIKFTDCGMVTLALSVADDALLFSVADTGRGIPPEAQDKIFDRFYQVDSGDARLSEGTGLGLFLVRELVSMMGGSVALQSAPGSGAVFRFTLPYPGPAVAVTARPTEAYA